MDEASRLAFVAQRDGPAAAVDFARRTLAIYRAAIKRQANGRRTRYGDTYRARLLASCCDFRAYIRAARNTGDAP